MSTQSIDSTDNVYSIQENSEKTLINTDDNNKAPLNDSSKDEKMNDSSDAEIPEIEQLAIKTTTEIQSSRNRKIKYGPYEKVVTTVIFSSKLIALNCLGNKKFVSLNKSKQLCANKFKIDGPAESFEMQYLSGGFIALLSKEKNKYCTAENEGKETLVANRPVIFGTWEVFEIYDFPNGYIALKSLSNGKFISAKNRRSEANLVANRVEVEGGFELFKIQNFLTI